MHLPSLTVKLEAMDSRVISSDLNERLLWNDRSFLFFCFFFEWLWNDHSLIVDLYSEPTCPFLGW